MEPLTVLPPARMAAVLCDHLERELAHRHEEIARLRSEIARRVPPVPPEPTPCQTCQGLVEHEGDCPACPTCRYLPGRTYYSANPNRTCYICSSKAVKSENPQLTIERQRGDRQKAAKLQREAEHAEKWRCDVPRSKPVAATSTVEERTAALDAAVLDCDREIAALKDVLATRPEIALPNYNSPIGGAPQCPNCKDRSGTHTPENCGICPHCETARGSQTFVKVGLNDPMWTEHCGYCGGKRESKRWYR